VSLGRRPPRPPGPAPAAPLRRRRSRPPGVGRRRARLALALAALILVVAVIVSGIGGGGLPRPPAASVADSAGPGDPFAYRSSREADYVARAIAGNANVLFVKSPGGVVATAARVARYRSAVDRATAGTGIDPRLVEGLMFVESAGRADAIAGSDPAGAAGLTQILAATGQTLLGMHIDLARSRKLTRQITDVENGVKAGRLAPLLARRAAADDRFTPAKEIAATVRYLEIAKRQFGRADLAVESYHMGIGNLRQVLGNYNSGQPVPYAQLYFDSAPTHHADAYRLLSGFGDDSWLYYWRVLGAVQLMRLYRHDRAELTRLNSLSVSGDAGAAVLHPTVRPFADPAALSDGYQSRQIVPLPSNAAALGLAFAANMGTGAAAVGAPRGLYRGLRPVALRLLIDLAAQVRRLSGVDAPLTIQSTVADEHYQQHTAGFTDPIAATGWSFAIRRRYAGKAQAVALQTLLDRLQSLNLITWSRGATTIQVTVAADAAAWLRRA
jgi:hypothetical protein